MSLPSFNTTDRILSLLQSAWATQLDPIVDNPLVNGRLIQGQNLISGNTTINHLLGRKLVGWIIVGQSAAASIYDMQSTNQMPNKTLILNSSAPCLVNIWVF